MISLFLANTVIRLRHISWPWQMKYMACLKSIATKQSQAVFTKSTSEENDIDGYQMKMIQAWFVSHLETFHRRSEWTFNYSLHLWGTGGRGRNTTPVPEDSIQRAMVQSSNPAKIKGKRLNNPPPLPSNNNIKSDIGMNFCRRNYQNKSFQENLPTASSISTREWSLCTWLWNGDGISSLLWD